MPSDNYLAPCFENHCGKYSWFMGTDCSLGYQHSLCPDQTADPALSKVSQNAELLRFLLPILLHLGENSNFQRAAQAM